MAVESGEYTPETLSNRTKIADLLLLQAMKPREIRKPLAGVGQLGEAALGGWLGYKAEEEQKQGTAAQAGAIAALLGGGAPAGTPMPSPSPAPTGASAAADEPSTPPTTLVGNNPQIPPQRMASLSPEAGIVAPPRAPVPSSNRVIGDDEGVKLGLYDAPKAPGMAPPTPVANVASALNPNFANRFSASEPARAPAAPPQAAEAPAPIQVAQNAPVPTAGLPMPSDNKAAIAKMLQDKNPYVRKLGISLGQNLITKQLEGDKPTDEMREYSLYRQQGGKDSFFDYKAGLKKAGAQNIQLNNTINPIVKGVGERFNDSMDTAKASIPQIQGIHEARKALDDGAITGLGADPKLFLAKAANLFGLDERSASNTEVARSAIGNSVLAKAKTLGANPSNTDRDYIEKVVGGQIQLEEPSIRRLLDMQEKWARQAIQRANLEGAKLLKAQPKELEHIAPLLNITEPPSYEEFLKANPRATATPAVPAGTVRWERGPDGKPRRSDKRSDVRNSDEGKVVSDASDDPIMAGQQFAMNARRDPSDTRRVGRNFDLPGGAGGGIGVKSPFPPGYHDKVPQETRLSGQGISHPGYRWEVYDKQTGRSIGEPYTNSRRAGTRMDKLDNEYGGYKYGKRPIPAADMSEEEKMLLKSLGL